MTIGVSLGRDGLASALVLASIAISNAANICRCTGYKHSQLVVSLIREDATLLSLRSVFEVIPDSVTRVPFGDSFSRNTLPFDASSPLQSNGEREELCMIVVREFEDW